MTFRIVTQPRLSWWPQIDLVYARSAELRGLFTDTLNKATQGYIAHTPLRMITSLTLKSKDTQSRLIRAEEGHAHKVLLLLMVRLIHADPMLLLNSQGKAGHEVQSSTLELINGLVSLVHQPTMPDVAQEAMEALLALHSPDKIEMWNPEAPINTFWDVSSQVLFSISQKLIQHQIANYTGEFLKFPGFRNHSINLSTLLSFRRVKMAQGNPHLPQYFPTTTQRLRQLWFTNRYLPASAHQTGSCLLHVSLVG